MTRVLPIAITLCTLLSLVGCKSIQQQPKTSNIDRPSTLKGMNAKKTPLTQRKKLHTPNERASLLAQYFTDNVMHALANAMNADISRPDLDDIHGELTAEWFEFFYNKLSDQDEGM